VERKWNLPRQAGRARFVYCAHDEAAWEMEPDASIADEPAEEVIVSERRAA
jgi:hypothetical protein